MLGKCFGLFFFWKPQMTKLFLSRRIGKNTVCYSTLKKKWKGLFWKMLPHLQALGWEPELCQCGFVRHMTLAITKNLSRFVF